MSEEVRYWDRVGAYVSRSFAEEYIERSQETGIKEVELPKETQALMDALEMERNKVQTIKNYMAEGLTKDEAKEKYTQTMNEMVGEALGIQVDDTQESEDASNEEE